MNRTAILCTSIIAALLGSAALLTAGPLSPPAGPVTSSYRTLTEVEPRTPISAATTPGDADSVFKIIQPGSYYLTGNVAGVASKHGIEIASGGVSIDLGGFDVRGVPGSLSGIISTVASLRGVSIAHGHVRDWGGSGIELQNADTASVSITDVRAVSNAIDGIRVGRDAIVQGCTATSNTGSGFLLSTSCTARDCSASFNATGFLLGAGVTAVHCNATQNTGTGINAGSECIVDSCSSFFNGTEGISVSNGSHVSGCAVLGSSTNGIRATFGCTIRENTLRQNGNSGVGAGIIIIGANNRIDSNNCTFADRGIEITSSGNFITRNTCANNTINYIVPTGNVFLAVSAATNPAAVSGSAGGVAPGSTDPSANFSF